ncbi:MAG: helix-turn-helix transcriptional regulator [Clostridiaceae bacterium]
MVLSRMELKKRIREARKLKSEKIGRNYTQVMLANDIDKSRQYISNLETGLSSPSFTSLRSIADACDVDFSFFECSEEDPSMNSSLVNPSKISDVRSAMEIILAQPCLMLNGKILSDDAKITLANAIQFGLQQTEEMEQ